MIFPFTNPIRFRDVTNTAIPRTINNVAIDEPFNGMDAPAFMPIHINGTAMIFEVFHTLGQGESLPTCYAENSLGILTTVNPTQLSITGYTGQTVWLFSYTPSVSGYDRFRFRFGKYYSDWFEIVTSDSTVSTLSYTHVDNTIGGIFVHDGGSITQTISFRAAINQFTGNTFAVYESDRAGFITNRATPITGFNLKIEAIHCAYLRTFEHVFSCSSKTLNGQAITTKAAVKASQLGRSTLNMLEIECFDSNNYGYVDL